MSKRTFASLRGQTGRPAPADSDERIESKAARLFETPDGVDVLRWLLERANEVTPMGASNDTLREAEGARRFMANTIRLISE